MKTILFITILLLFSCSGTAKKKSAPPGAGAAPSSRAAAVQPVGKNDFDTFLDRFNRDSAFQVSSVHFPLFCLSWAGDPDDMEGYDTLLISKEDYEIELLRDTVGNYIPGQPTYISVEKKGNKRLVLLKVEDSGIHITYFFRFRKRWELYRVEDAST
jgi:hypothetical protein